MDEYDELFEVPDDFEDQFADELEVLAQMEDESPKQGRHQSRGPTDNNSDIRHLLDDQPITPKAKRQKQDAGVVKRLFNASQEHENKAQSADITPPSSPEQYEPSHTFRSAPAVLDISGFATIPETPRRPPAAAPASLLVLKRPPLEGEYISVTDSSGSRVYLRQKEDTGKKRHQQVMEESQRLTELLTSSVNDVFVEPESREDEDDPGDAEGQTSRLWVDRFSPRHYTELLSDDFTNRCLLKWLKLWDTVVFGRERKSRPARSDRQAANQHSFKPNQGNQNPNRFKTKIEMTEEILEAELDQYKRPRFKVQHLDTHVALLSGPPGLGKTTLAHVIAKHAGYNVVEINASDDRSAEVFQKRIDTATQMKSVLGTNERPNCLIIDEIDGAPAGLYDNYLSMRVRDPNMHSVCEALDWLSFSDRVNHLILHNQNFSLMRYLPFLSVTFHFLFAHTHVPRISYPHSHYEATSRLLVNRNALSSMLADIPASIRTRISHLSLTLDILTLLLNIISPKLRPRDEGKKSAAPKPSSNHQQRLENIVKQTTVETRPEVDFFGRAIAPKPQRPQPSSETGEKCPVLSMGTAVGNSDVWFRFNEGMSNAVRRNVYIRELL
ncbi:hypothetical protein F2P81_010101 [Scophthalmus maximus]|uniref:AAA+ ATPase domain-containing protein n=1 Tax=Scophthalmus maximus TaxID=52904 RepID=A0A6A4SUU8_SCOMX|nr:hypothetical protein F2P81_010101 [Scophthalmus maximus]